MKELEIWGGLECTLNRVGDVYHDQCLKNGHYDRLSDLQLFADLKFKKIRYPCLWEIASPNRPEERNWDYFDERLGEIKRLEITPIVGFLHHGSGPKFTSLIDEKMPELLAAYAEDFSLRYPWVKDYTPVNEILTTARFSCLYGHWYPHERSDYFFLKAVFIECKATVLAMRAIRKHIPDAKLVQTEDIGKCQSTPVLKYQCNFENERRWLSFDILCGKFNKKHPLYKYVKKSGISDETIEWHLKNVCTPDVIGLNHYLLSNRYLDHDMRPYPQLFHGGNNIHQYADVGVIDTGQAELPLPSEIFLEAHKRFRLPIAITEVHTRGYREDQMKWFHYIWVEANHARNQGANILAITAWSLLGTYDWNSLCTENAMFYEPGVFDIRGGILPRKTALADLIIDINTKKHSNFPLLKTEMHWKTPRRILFAAKPNAHSVLETETDHKVVLITGGTGTLGRAFAKVCRLRNIPYKLVTRQEMELSDIHSVRKVILKVKPWAVINAAGYVRVDDAEKEKELCFRENVIAPTNLALVCAELDIRFMTFSSDLVFNGLSEKPYHEDHPVDPINTYGLSKAVSEEKVLSILPSALIIRSSAFFGPWDDYNFATVTLKNALENVATIAATDCKVSPTYLPDLVDASLDLLIDRANGIHHLVNAGETTWYNFAKTILRKSNVRNEKSLLIKKRMEEITNVKRPLNSCLITKKAFYLPTLEDALERYLEQRNL